VKYQTVIRMLDGSSWRGTLDVDLSGQTSIFPASNAAVSAEHFFFESSDGRNPGLIRFDAVRSIYLNVDHESEMDAGLRFFDAAPIASFLWVRVTFVDGEAVEGMAPNHWSTFCGPVISLSLPDQRLDQLRALIPRASIAEFQVITTR
jgi:Family of unknown function (DUF6982)